MKKYRFTFDAYAPDPRDNRSFQKTFKAMNKRQAMRLVDSYLESLMEKYPYDFAEWDITNLEIL